MVVLVKLIGIVIVVVGVIFLITPKTMKSYAEFWKKEKRLYGGAVASLIIGIVFLLAATQCRIAWVIALFGILSIIKGVMLFALGPKMLKSWIDRWTGKPDKVVRLLAVLVLAFGGLIIYAAYGTFHLSTTPYKLQHIELCQ